MHWGDHGWGMGFGWMFMILFWVLVISGIVYGVRSFLVDGKPKGRAETALDILDTRYAKGELSKEEYESMKKDILRS